MSLEAGMNEGVRSFCTWVLVWGKLELGWEKGRYRHHGSDKVVRLRRFGRRGSRREVCFERGMHEAVARVPLHVTVMQRNNCFLAGAIVYYVLVDMFVGARIELNTLSTEYNQQHVCSW